MQHIEHATRREAAVLHCLFDLLAVVLTKETAERCGCKKLKLCGAFRIARDTVSTRNTQQKDDPNKRGELCARQYYRI